MLQHFHAATGLNAFLLQGKLPSEDTNVSFSKSARYIGTPFKRTCRVLQTVVSAEADLYAGQQYS